MNAGVPVINFLNYVLLSYVTKCYINIVAFCYNKVNSFYKKQRILKNLKGLKEIRKKKGYSQLKVAFDLNISREALSYYENDKRNPDITMLCKMSEYFNVSIDYLIKGEDFYKK